MNRLATFVVATFAIVLSSCKAERFRHFRAAAPMGVVDKDGKWRGVAAGVAVVGDDVLFNNINWQWTVGLGTELTQDPSGPAQQDDDSIDFVLATGPIFGRPESSWFSIGPVGFVDPDTGEADWGGMVSLFISISQD